MISTKIRIMRKWRRILKTKIKIERRKTSRRWSRSSFKITSNDTDPEKKRN
jgi:hypothetical protein